ncbi:MAG: nickel-dependent hydrogenase large subunit [Mariprofundus sp.]|nr:nickel-dependent hydrogenase large subunit [Mariprofundus sp.]
MQLTMSLEGEVSIILHAKDGMVHAVNVASKRPLLANQLLQQKTPQLAITLVSSLYRICAKAQACASIDAMETALGIQTHASTRQVRVQILRMETLREHAWRILLDWPLMINEKPDNESLKQLLQIDRYWQQAVDSKAQAFQIEARALQSDGLIKADNRQTTALLDACSELLKKAVFSRSPAQWLALKDADELADWAEKCETSAARLIHRLMHKGWEEIGQSQIQALPDLDSAMLERLLNKQNANRFMHTPEIDGEQYETTPYSRQYSSALIQSLSEQFGNGLLTRFVAVLVELAVMQAEMRSCLNRGVEYSARPSVKSGVKNTRKSDNAMGIGVGVGVVEAARGRLVHRVRLQDDCVAEYQIVAPTEWNFHPQGVLARSLKYLAKGDDEHLEEQAGLLIHAMDPCVKFSLQVKSDA